jgi:hypothetical protein
MALEIRSLRDLAPRPAAITADRRLWLTADRDAVVEDGDPAAAFLLAPPGGEIPMTEAERLGLSVEDGRVVLPQSAKARRRPADKMRAKPGDK